MQSNKYNQSTKTQDKAINILFSNNKHTNRILTDRNIIHIEKMKHTYKYTKYPDKIPKDTRTIYDELNKNKNERLRNKMNFNIIHTTT